MIAKQITEKCITCNKLNNKIQKKLPDRRKTTTLRPFQCIQIDFTELPAIRRLKYILVLVDHLTRWVEPYPFAPATASVVSKIILEQLISKYEIVEHIDSDQRSHFISKVLHEIMKSL